MPVETLRNRFGIRIRESAPRITPEQRSPGSSLLSPSAWSWLRETLRLSDRELQIVQRFFQDDKEETIAYDLGISPHTVSTYVQRLYSKLNVGSRPQLIIRVMAEHLVQMSGMDLTGEDPTWTIPQPRA